jgi:pyridoxine 4-dehydrogenase
MNARPWSRRTLLLQGTALMSAAAVWRSAPAGMAPGQAGRRGAPAAAAGTLMLGGDLEVARLGFGAMRITGDGIWGEPPDTHAARALLRRAVELGVNFIDTADAYGPEVSERLIAEALHPYPRGLVIATKGGLTRPSRAEWRPDGRPEHLRAACEASLKRLKLERIDLYQFHRPDPEVPFEDSVGELKRLQQQGKIRHIGLSNIDVDQLRKAQGIIKVVSVQNRYNIADRASADVLAVCEREQIAFLPWGPLAQRAQASATPDASLVALKRFAEERKLALSVAALAWLLAKSPVMLPIPGTSRVDHLEQDVSAAQVRISAAQMRRIG